MHEIQDLCSALSTQCPGCFGFVDEDEHRFVFYKSPNTASMDHVSTVTLDKLLQKAHTLTRRKRYFLAFTLASSYLQLGSTPWLNTPIQRDSIVFLHNPSDLESTALDHPYIRREMTKTTPTPPVDAISSLAIQWSKMVSEEAGPEFAEAIEWCLHAKELSDGSWRKEIWSHVIVPLEACHKQVSQKPMA
ncbi:hypothetical protein BDV96DRAFT_615165 [Lophiotrema nucula]|uniref:DUF7580 domain-containing protein n=1 Tax=Lophiotrema nucula TaxID=690887 RepID=A0A6A5YWW7_9PLEO|nr:hypothetical protein BDV96DRAFT_615165 [Lophiotrema nucula]